MGGQSSRFAVWGGASPKLYQLPRAKNCGPILPSQGTKNEWGPRWWDHLHQRSIYWPQRPSPRQVLNEHVFLQAFFQALPCPECAGHATEYYWRNYPNLQTNEQYHAWVFTFHNSVNARLGKKQMDYSDYQEQYRRHLLVNGLV